MNQTKMSKQFAITRILSNFALAGLTDKQPISETDRQTDRLADRQTENQKTEKPMQAQHRKQRGPRLSHITLPVFIM